MKRKFADPVAENYEKDGAERELKVKRHDFLIMIM